MFWSAKRNVNQVYLSTKRNAQNLIFSSRPCCQPTDLQPNLPLAFRMQTSEFFLQDFITFFTPIQLQSKANFQLQFLCRIQKQSSREIVVSLHFSICIRVANEKRVNFSFKMMIEVSFLVSTPYLVKNYPRAKVGGQIVNFI